MVWVSKTENRHQGYFQALFYVGYAAKSTQSLIEFWSMLAFFNSSIENSPFSARGGTSGH